MSDEHEDEHGQFWVPEMGQREIIAYLLARAAALTEFCESEKYGPDWLRKAVVDARRAAEAYRGIASEIQFYNFRLKNRRPGHSPDWVDPTLPPPDFGPWFDLRHDDVSRND